MAQTKSDPIGALAYLGANETPSTTSSALPTSDTILANMQKRMDELNSPQNQFENALQKAHAWTLYDKTPAFKHIAEQENQRADQLQNIGTTMAQIKMQRDRMANANKVIANLSNTGTGGAGVGGVGAGGLNSELMSALALNAANPDKVAELLKSAGDIKLKAEIEAKNRPDYYKPDIDIVIYDKDGKPKLTQVSVADIQSNPNLYKATTPAGKEKLNTVIAGGNAPTPSATVPVDKLQQAITEAGGFGAPSALKPATITPEDVAKKLETDFGIKLGPNALKRDRTGQSELIERAKAGDKNVFMPAPLVEGKEVYHENAIDVPTSVSEKYMNELGYYRPFPQKDPVHYVPFKAGAPDKNKATIEDLYKTHGGDVEKVIAEQYAGKNAFNEDGSINRNAKPAGRPNDPTVGEYVNQVKRRIEIEPTAQKEAPTTVSELKSQQEIEKARGLKSVESDVKKVDEFEANTKPLDLERARAQTKRAIDILRTNPNVSGVLASEGVKNALLQFAQGKMPHTDLEGVLFTAMAKSPLDVSERRELAGYLAESEIRGRGLIKGTGAISDYEQKILSKIAGSISDPSEVLYKRFRVFDKTNEFNLAARKLWDKSEFKSLREFEKSEKYQDLYKAYVEDMDNVYNEKVDFSKARNQPSAPTPTGRPKSIDELIKKHGG